MALLYITGLPSVCLITGLSTDTKPAPTINFTFLETDTDKQYLADGAAWNEVLNDAYEVALNKGTANGYAGLDAGAKVPVAQLPTGATSLTVCIGDDARLADARTPLAHAASHQSGGADAIKLDDLAATDDNTDLNASTAKHGLMQKYPGGTTNFLRADGAFAAPPGGAGASWTIHEQSLVEGWRGRFTITDVGIAPTSKVIIHHAPGPYTGKGTRADEAEMDPLWCVAEPGSGQAIVYWRTQGYLAHTFREIRGTQLISGANTQHGSPRLAVDMEQKILGRVRGNVKFLYTVA